MNRVPTIPTRFLKFLTVLAIILLVSGCKSPKSATPTYTLVPPTATSLPTVAPTPTQTADEQLASRIDAYMTDLTEKGQFSGSILVGKEGKVLVSKGYGMADLEHNVPNTPQTKFRVGSITKQFTAMAILQLQQKGRLNVQDPICKYISPCPEAWAPITIHHLLTHTSGIHNYLENPDIGDFVKRNVTPSEIIDQFRDLPLDFTPGDKFQYSNSGYILLGYIIDRLIHIEYTTDLTLYIFIPLKMENTLYDNPRTVIPNRAQGYSDSRTNAEYIDMSVVYAAGGWLSTVEDLYLWDQALYTDQLISPELREVMFTPFASIPDSDDGYGYGWVIGRRFNQKWINHGGFVNGFSAKIDRYPESQVVVIILSNFESVDVDSISEAIGRMIFGEE